MAVDLTADQHGAPDVRNKQPEPAPRLVIHEAMPFAPLQGEAGRAGRVALQVGTGLRDNLADCIGCGCLSLKSCRLSNPGDVLGEHGPGAARL